MSETTPGFICCEECGAVIIADTTEAALAAVALHRIEGGCDD